MKNSIFCLSIASALGIGVVSGILGTRAYFKKYYEERYEKDVESVKKAFDQSRKIEENNKTESASDDIYEISVDRTDVHISPIQQEMKRYDTFSKNEEKVAEKPNKDRTGHPQEEDYDPYFVDVEVFTEEDGYKKLECHYYVDDGVVTGPDGEPVNIFETVGDDNMDEFSDWVDEVCWIRNDKACEDYEVTKVFGAYGDIEGEQDF